MTTWISVQAQRPEVGLEQFEKGERNIAEVVTNLRGSPNADVIVNLHLSPEAARGFATELLRLLDGPTPRTDDFVEMIPVSPGNACQYMGMYLAPDSCRLNVGIGDLGSLPEHLGEV